MNSVDYTIVDWSNGFLKKNAVLKKKNAEIRLDMMVVTVVPKPVGVVTKSSGLDFARVNTKIRVFCFVNVTQYHAKTLIRISVNTVNKYCD